jgi:dienelactone hydrolase
MTFRAMGIAVACLSLVAASLARADEVDGQKLLREAAAEALKIVPATQPAAEFVKEGLRSMFYDGPGWKGKPTRVFAWFGLPKDYVQGAKVPAMLLVHGGGGTAFSQWVKMWNDRGYAALAMDMAGQLPRGKPWERDSQGGPMGWGGFEQVGDDVRDQWPFQAEMDVILGDSLLRSFPEVDTDRVGIVGISWGGYLTCLAAALDPRFKIAISVYGCGFLGEDSVWLKNFQQIGPEKTKVWLHDFDPSEYLGEVKMPMLWVDGTNDLNYPIESLAKSYALPKGERTLVTRVRMKHSHSAGWAPAEIYAYADWKLKGGKALARVTGSGTEKAVGQGDGVIAWVDVDDPTLKAELNYTSDSGDWKGRGWKTEGAGEDAMRPRFSSALPMGTTAWFFNLTDDRGLVVSSELQFVP